MAEKLSSAEFQQRFGATRVSPGKFPATPTQAKRTKQPPTVGGGRVGDPLTTEAALWSMAYFFEIPEAKAKFFINQLKLSGKIILLALILSACNQKLYNGFTPRTPNSCCR